MNRETTSPFFTVFTPVFNGEKHLYRVFKSIAEQTFSDFEWIIINDGSTDNTATLARSFLADHPEIDAIYHEQPNSGKHISWNKAVEIARGKLFVPADADDYFFPETLSYFFEEWNKLTPEDQAMLSGINVLCLDNDNEDVVGDIFPVDGMRTTNVELEFDYKLHGEKWGCVRTDLLKSRPFPIIKGSHFPESYLWYHFSKKYKVICFNKPLRRYYTTDTGIMQHELKNVHNPAQVKINIKYYVWLLLNFGLYILLHSPAVFIQSVKILLKSVMKKLRR